MKNKEPKSFTETVADLAAEAKLTHRLNLAKPVEDLLSAVTEMGEEERSLSAVSVGNRYSEYGNAKVKMEISERSRIAVQNENLRRKNVAKKNWAPIIEAAERYWEQHPNLSPERVALNLLYYFKELCQRKSPEGALLWMEPDKPGGERAPKLYSHNTIRTRISPYRSKKKS